MTDTPSNKDASDFVQVPDGLVRQGWRLDFGDGTFSEWRFDERSDEYIGAQAVAGYGFRFATFVHPSIIAALAPSAAVVDDAVGGETLSAAVHAGMHWKDRAERAEAGLAFAKGDGRDRFERMFMAAVTSLAEISEALGIPEDVAATADGNFEILEAIAALRGDAKPVAWSRCGLIRDDEGRPIGEDEPEVRWCEECPEEGAGWQPLYGYATSLEDGNCTSCIGGECVTGPHCVACSNDTAPPAALSAAALARVEGPVRQALVDALVVAHIYRVEHDSDPRKAINDLIAWHVDVALDPRVSERAAALAAPPQAPAAQCDGKVAVAWAEDTPHGRGYSFAQELVDAGIALRSGPDGEPWQEAMDLSADELASEGERCASVLRAKGHYLSAGLLREALRRLSQPQAVGDGVPEGFVLVPKKPTRAMVDALIAELPKAWDSGEPYDAPTAYRAMLAAANPAAAKAGGGK